MISYFYKNRILSISKVLKFSDKVDAKRFQSAVQFQNPILFAEKCMNLANYSLYLQKRFFLYFSILHVFARRLLKLIFWKKNYLITSINFSSWTWCSKYFYKILYFCSCSSFSYRKIKRVIWSLFSNNGKRNQLSREDKLFLFEIK